MGKTIILLLMLTVITGCSWNPLKTDVQYVSKPILYCPTPPIMERPHLLIHDLHTNDFKDPGKVVQYYKFSVKQLQNYTTLLENVLDQYDKTSKAYKSLEQELNNNFPSTEKDNEE